MNAGKLFINGEFVDADSRESIESINPATELPIGRIADASEADVARAVLAARKAFDEGPWPRMKPHERGRQLRKVAAGILARAEELAQLETADSGKPIFDNRTGDIPEAAFCFEHFAGCASAISGRTLDVPAGDFFDYTLREPWGVIAAVAPWNFPLVNAAWKIAPAIAAGNCVVYKPAEETSLTTLLLAEIIQRAEFPQGVVNIVTGKGASTGRALIAHPSIDKISFTGSTATGKSILHAAADRVVPAILELGGKSANVAFDDCDIDKAVDGALFGVFFNAGQVCTAGSRLILHAGIYERFMEKLLAGAKSIRIGDPADERTRMGPLVSARHRARVKELISSGKQQAGRLLLDRSEDIPKRGCFVGPMIFDQVAPEARINIEEIFGPVLVVHRFESEAEAICLANATSYGLAAGVWTRDLSRAHRVARALQAGTVWVNTYNIAAVNLPNAAWKESGIGCELGREGFESFTKVKNVCMDLASAPIGYFS